MFCLVFACLLVVLAKVGGDAPGDPHLPCTLILERLLGWIQDRSERLVAGTGEQIEP